MIDDPLVFAINATINTRYNTSTYVSQLLNHATDDIAVAMDILKRDLSLSASSRKVTYKEINPDLSVHDIYTSRHGIREDHRVSFSRFRLSTHWLAVETGRWNRRGRGCPPLEERLCPCGQIQTELHVILECPISQHVRDTYVMNSFRNLFDGSLENATVGVVINSVLKLYNQN